MGFNKDTTIEELAANPNAYGFPTFEQYCQPSIREKYNRSADELFAAITAGPDNIRKTLKKIKFKMFGYNVETLEKAEQIAKDYGYTIDQLDMKPEMEQAGEGKYNVIVYLVPKEKPKPDEPCSA